MPDTPIFPSNLKFPQKVRDKKFLRDHEEQSFRGVFLGEYPGAYSASDAYAMVTLPGGITRALGQLAAISISTHRDTFPVATMGSVQPKGFTQGHRTVGGTLVFHTIDSSALAYNSRVNRINERQHSDEMPLFDIIITYVNDIGMVSVEEIVGVRILDFGKAVSLENLHPIESYSFMALDYHPLRSLIKEPGNRIQKIGRPLSREKKPVKLSNSSITTYDPVIDENLSQIYTQNSLSDI